MLSSMTRSRVGNRYPDRGIGTPLGGRGKLIAFAWAGERAFALGLVARRAVSMPAAFGLPGGAGRGASCETLRVDRVQNSNQDHWPSSIAGLACGTGPFRRPAGSIGLAHPHRGRIDPYRWPRSHLQFPSYPVGDDGFAFLAPVAIELAIGAGDAGEVLAQIEDADLALRSAAARRDVHSSQI